MALPYPQNPAADSAPNPYFQDNNFVRGDQMRSMTAQAWDNMLDLDSRLNTAEGDISTLQGDVSTLQTDVADLETQVQRTGQPDYSGLRISNNATHPNYMIDVAAGRCLGLDPGGVFAWPIVLAAAISKDINNLWVAGDGNGGLDTGSVASGTWYYLYAILNPLTQASDVIISASASAPNATRISTYTVHRRLRCAIRTDGSGSIRMFFMTPNGWVWWSNGLSGSTNSIPLDITLNNPGTAAVLHTLTVPPLEVTARLNVSVTNPTGDATTGLTRFSSTGSKDIAPAFTGTPLGQVQQATYAGTGAGNSGFTEIDVDADASSQVRSRTLASDTDITLYGATLGWLEPISEL